MPKIARAAAAALFVVLAVFACGDKTTTLTGTACGKDNVSDRSFVVVVTAEHPRGVSYPTDPGTLSKITIGDGYAFKIDDSGKVVDAVKAESATKCRS